MIKNLKLVVFQKDNEENKFESDNFKERLNYTENDTSMIVAFTPRQADDGIGVVDGMCSGFQVNLFKELKNFKFHKLKEISFEVFPDLEYHQINFLFECLNRMYKGKIKEEVDRDTGEFVKLTLDFKLDKCPVRIVYKDDESILLKFTTGKKSRRDIKSIKSIVTLFRNAVKKSLVAFDKVEDKLYKDLEARYKEFDKTLSYQVFLDRWTHKIVSRDIFAKVHSQLFGYKGAPSTYLKKYKDPLGLEFIDKQVDYKEIKDVFKQVFDNLDSLIDEIFK